jgi:hypothetical protein
LLDGDYLRDKKIGGNKPWHNVEQKSKRRLSSAPSSKNSIAGSDYPGENDHFSRSQDGETVEVDLT